MSLLDGLTNDRAAALLAELSFDQLCGLLFAKASQEGKRVDVRIRPREHRVKVKSRTSAAAAPAGGKP